MRLAIFLSLFLLTPLFLVSANVDGGQTSVTGSENVCLFAVPRSLVTLPDISVEGVKDSAINTAKAIQEKVDTAAIALADKLEETKRPSSVSASTVNDGGLTSVIHEDDTQVLGVSGPSWNNMAASAYNAGVDVLSLLIRHWMWTISGLGVLALFWSFKT